MSWFGWPRDRCALPPMRVRVRNLLQSVARNWRQWREGGPMLIPNEIRRARSESCNECSHRKEMWCCECGCLLLLKNKFAAESCPIGRWASVSRRSIEEFERENGGRDGI